MSNLTFDLEFLLQAANFHGGPNAPHSEAARKAVEVIAEKYRVMAELQLKVAQERVKGKDPVEIAQLEDASD